MNSQALRLAQGVTRVMARVCALSRSAAIQFLIFPFFFLFLYSDSLFL